jgi:two-component system, chemotaxis family, sensor kinase CheA
MNLDQALQTFIHEARELLTDMEDALLTIEQAEVKTELINAIFRAAHTIKGSAGLFSLDHVVAFTHVVESLLDHVRDGKMEIEGELVTVLLSCCDHIGTMIEAISGGKTEPDAAMLQRGAPLLEKLRVFLAKNNQPSVDIALDDVEVTKRVLNQNKGDDHWHISLLFGKDVLKNGMDPLSFIRYLGKLGTISGIVVLPQALPVADEMDPEVCYLGYEIAFQSTCSKTDIENAFEFVRDDCRLQILPPNSHISNYISLIESSSDDSSRLGELLVRAGTLTAKELQSALTAQNQTIPPKRIGTILVEQNLVHPAVVDAALSKQKQVSDLQAKESQSIRVDADKLDNLINLIGELIIVGAGVNLISQRSMNAELQERASKLNSLVESVRDSALQLRMVKIGATFKRFQRVVHDVSKEFGKDIELIIDGEDTELDKTVVEKIGDPLMHLVRNALDHGIASPDARIALGKRPRGTVKLNAYHDSGHIVITVSDDGAGLKRDKILAKAIERGLVDPHRTLTDDEICALVFEPGFSTADQVSSLSGRGVGMDVVKRNITALRGTVSIQSEEGIGTTVTVRLPLTLAIIDGFLVSISNSVFAIPLEMVDECIAFSAEPGHDYTNLRGEVLPFVRLRDLFEVKGEVSRRENIVVLKNSEQRAGLVVDTLLGEFQTVIKPLNGLFNHVKCVSGSTILGSGEVALILDVPALVSLCIKNEKKSTHRNYQLGVH